jgi:hypothetical protein
MSTLYAAISRSIKDLGRFSPFKKGERGKFEAKSLRAVKLHCLLLADEVG